jgi:hypothetical protein
MNNQPPPPSLICARLLAALVLVTCLMQTAQPAGAQPQANKGQINLYGPAGSRSFGYSVTVLPNGNFVVTDPYYSPGTTTFAGAVYLYNGASKALISTMKGSLTTDLVGNGGITVLQDGNFLVRSPMWTNGAVAGAGAARYCSSWDTCYGVISASNSLVGSSSQDYVGAAIRILSDGNFLVQSPDWDDGPTQNVGAVTYCSTSSSCYGAVSFSNSLIGEHAQDNLSFNGILILDNGRYVVLSTSWDRGGITDAGAATYCSSGGCSGYVSLSNSLVGSTSGDRVSYGSIRLPYSGNYLVLSPNWDNGGIIDRGAATWCSGSSGCTGEVTLANSLVGSQAGDGSDLDAVASLDVNNYMVLWPYWDNGGVADAGAVKWCPGGSGCVGTMSAGSSLVGSHINDQVGLSGTEMGSGRYMVASYNWNGTAAGAGAVTFCTNPSGCAGSLSTANSLVGGNDGDHVGSGSFTWDTSSLIFSTNSWHYFSAANAGAVTFCDLDYLSNCSGYLSTDNSLVGTHASDQVGSDTLLFLSNGNYLVSSTHWNGGLGAVTFCSGGSGCKGAVSSDNSLVGSYDEDGVGYRVQQLKNGNYVVGSPYWNNGLVSDAGAVTFCSGTSGCMGTISPANSLVGTRLNDHVGNPSIETLENNDYLVESTYWGGGEPNGEGNVAWCGGSSGCLGSLGWYPRRATGTISEGTQLYGKYDPVNNQVLVGREEDNIVTVLGSKIEHLTFLPMVRR